MTGVPYCKNCGAQELQDQSFCSSCGTSTKVERNEVTALPYFPMDVPDTRDSLGLASFWRRLSGYLIDSLILLLVVTLPLGIDKHTSVGKSLLTLLAEFLYGFLFMAYGNGQTLGMRAVGTRAVNADDGAKITRPQAFRRAFAYSALLAVAAFYHAHTTTRPSGRVTTPENEVLIIYALLAPHYLDLLWVAWDKRRQSLHDKFAHTVVLRLPKKVST
jgi:uncharacterized RDD family membrane protein YckC